ncbi:MAG TPA: CHAT domain-containing protein [Thermoanaerobaculia bacterium]
MLGLGNALRARSQEGVPADLEEAVLTYRRLLAVCDPADQNWAVAHMNLGVALYERLQGNPGENLVQAIAAFREALAVWQHSEHPQEWARVRFNLANALVHQYQLDLPDSRHILDEAIVFYRDALAAVSPLEAPADWVIASCNLAVALSLVGDFASREEAVMTVRKGLSVLSRSHEPEIWARAQQLLGTFLVERNGEDRSQDLEEAVTAFRRALRIWRRETAPRQWAKTTISLAQTLLDRELGNPAHSIQRAIRHLREVLSFIHLNFAREEWINATTLLGECLIKRGSGNRLLDFEEAIRCFRRVARAQSPQESPEELSVTFFYLADAFLDRPRGSRARNLETAVSFCRQALSLLSRADSPLLWAAAQRKLGHCLLDRLRGDRSASLEESIDCYRNALKVFSVETTPYEWALTLSDLGNALVYRIREDRSGSHEEAIEAYEQALTILRKETYPQDWARTMMNVGVAYSERLLGEPHENLELSISAFQEALSVRRTDTRHDHWAETMLNLGAVYQDPRGKDRAHGIERAIETYRQILRATKRRTDPLTWAEATLNLGTAYSDRVLGEPANNVETAIAAYRRALAVMSRHGHPMDWALTQFNLGEAYERRILGTRELNLRQAAEAYESALRIHDPRTLPLECRRTASSLGELGLRTGRWQQAASSFRIALRAAETLYRSSLLASSREVELSAFPEIYRHAAYALARNGRTGEALAVLERGKAREIGEALARDQADIEGISREEPSLYRRYLQAARQLQKVERTERSADQVARRELIARRGLEPLRAEARQARGNLEAVVSEIRKLPAHQDFLRPLDASQIDASVRPGRCLAYLNVTAAGTQIFLLLPSPGGRVRRKVLWEDSFDAKRLGVLLSQWRLHAPPRTEISPALRVLGTLAGVLAREVRRCGLERATLIPCGPLSFFPLHAALYRTEAGETALLDEIEVSYAPSARLLATSEKALQSLHLGVCRLVGVGDPEASEENPLLFAGGELSFISRLFAGEQNCLLFGQAASREALLRNLSEATYLHLACHGQFIEEDPFASCLFLAHGEFLRAREIVSDGPLTRTRLAVLSACQSARTDIDRLPDEAIGLPSVFLQAGIPGVVGTLWPVDDLSTALLMARFYDLHLHGDGQGPAPPVRALRRAQLWLRDVRAGELVTFFQEQRRTREEGGPALDAAAIAAGLSRFVLEEPESRPFEDPYYWAPFVFVGV